VHILRAPRAHNTFSATRFRSQAFAVWQRCNHVLSHIPPEKEPVLLNLDETSVALHHGDQKGNVIAKTRSFQPGVTPVQRVSRRELRACLTHVAIIADRVAAAAVRRGQLGGGWKGAAAANCHAEAGAPVLDGWRCRKVLRSLQAVACNGAACEPTHRHRQRQSNRWKKQWPAC